MAGDPSIGALLHRFPILDPCTEPLEAAARAIVETARRDELVLVCGNGGSAADAEHIVGELVKEYRCTRAIPESDREKLESVGKPGAQLIPRLQRGVRALSLGSQVSVVSAIGNDSGADQIFAQQVYVYGRPGGLLFALSTSGNSENILQALTVARAFGLITVGLTGAGGGRMKELCDICIVVPAAETFEIQEYHVPLYHTLCEMVERELFG